MDKLTYMKLIEEISLNAWPSYKMELYDGWLIRFSYNYTYRTNSVEQVGPSSIPLEEKISYCRQVYTDFHSPASFKISPLLDSTFDSLLAKKGYHKAHCTEVMTMPMENFVPDSFCQGQNITVKLEEQISNQWIDSLFRLNKTTDPTLLRIVPTMYNAIPKETLAASIETNGKITASGLGIFDRGHVGLYAIYVDPAFRGKGYARCICNAILREALKKGVKHAYLQVVQGNHYARQVYESLGFQYFYTYWFRTLNT